MHYFPVMATPPITVVETATFVNEADGLLNDGERRDLIGFLAENPLAGKVMPGTGGVRKVRWARGNEGKSGGYRAIYYYHSEGFPLFALLVYPKSGKDSLTQGEKNMLKKLVKELVENYG